MKKFYYLLILTVTVLPCAFNLFAQAKIIYRFNADYELTSDLNTPVTLSDVTISSNLPDEELAARGSEGWGYDSPLLARFNGNGFISSQESVGLSFFGTAKFSGEIWFYPNTKDGFLFEWDDSAKSTGIQMFLQDGLLVYQAKVGGEFYSTVSAQEIEILNWYRLNWIYERSGSDLMLKIYLNESVVAEKEITLDNAGSSTIINANVKLGKQSYNHKDIPVFSGDIYSANIKNYIPDKVYFESLLPFDGTGYLGLASFHDYNVGSTEDNIDLRITQNNTPVDLSLFVPYTNENFIPQGVTNSYEDENYNEASGYIYISMYNKTVDNVIREKRSIIVELDPSENYRVRRCFRLHGVLGYSHAGGIAYHNNAVYVSSSRSIERYDLPEYSEREKYIDLNTETSKYYSVQSIASFVTYYRDTMWVGDYVSASGTGTPYLYGYPMDEEGNVLSGVAPKLYLLPKQVQGAAWFEENGEDVLFISSGEGNNSSSIFKVNRKNLFKTSEPVPDTTYKVPSGAEDISFDRHGNMFNVSESAAKYFQKRSSPWDAYYPFIFIINNRYLIDSTTVSVDEDGYENLVPESFELGAYPNPFNGQVSLRYFLTEAENSKIVFYNILGVKVDSTDKLAGSKGWHTHRWTPKNLSSGAYFSVLVVNGTPRKTSKLVYIK